MAASYLLDTNTIIAALKGAPSVLSRLAGLAPSRVHLSSVVLGELLTGAEKSEQSAGRRAALTELTEQMPAVPFDHEAAEHYARIRSALERKGQSIGPMDLMIAAQAASRGLIMVTDNLREFRRAPGLTCENWLRKS